jgi:hypothetical protein
MVVLDISGRVRPLNRVVPDETGDVHVLCWLQQTLRAWDNR